MQIGHGERRDHLAIEAEHRATDVRHAGGHRAAVNLVSALADAVERGRQLRTAPATRNRPTALVRIEVREQDQARAAGRQIDHRAHAHREIGVATLVFLAKDDQPFRARPNHQVAGLVDADRQLVHHGPRGCGECLCGRGSMRQPEHVVGHAVTRGLGVFLQPAALLQDHDDAEQLAHRPFELGRDLGNRQARLGVGQRLDDVHALLESGRRVTLIGGRASGADLGAAHVRRRLPGREAGIDSASASRRTSRRGTATMSSPAESFAAFVVRGVAFVTAAQEVRVCREGTQRTTLSRRRRTGGDHAVGRLVDLHPLDQ